MALVLKDRVQETTAVVGTGTMTLTGAVLGFQSFASIGNGNTTYYAVFDTTAGDWEVGIGTYTASGTTLSRTTVLSSSNGGSLVSFAAGTKQVICTYPSERAVWMDSAGSYPVQNVFNSLTATTATLTNGTVSTAPSSGTDIANKTYVDTVAADGIHYHQPVYVESPDTAGNLTATYNQPGGAGVGVGATLTNAGTQVALTIDGVLMTVGKRVLIYNQTAAAQNGVYTVTTVGTASTNWVLTRATDADTYAPSSPNSLGQGDAFFVTNGNTGAGETYVCNTVGTITFGTTAITFTQISATIPYLAGTGLNLSPSTTFNISNTGVTAASYGLAASVPTIAVNAQGQITSASNTAIAIAAGAVSGLAASATTDTTVASNITSGTLPSGRLSGSYTGITAVGTLNAGTWNATTIGPTYGGTGFASYAVGDILYADTTTSLAKLPDVAVGNALISGGVNSAPSWGKIGLATSVSGTLPVANGGTGVTSSTGTGSVVLSSSPSITSPSLTTPAIGSAGADFAGSTSGTTTLKASAVAGTTTVTMPGTTGTLALTSDIPSVNNGTLTMAVSGTGLSGSATFSANQSGSSSFTVASNATDANTASTLVARDASGNFSAGTITATLSGNATNVSGVVAVANGGTGTSTPSLVAGSGVSVSGSWPNQTIATSVGINLTATTLSANYTIAAGTNGFSVGPVTVQTGYSVTVVAGQRWVVI
jgi:hypothetical protein